MHFFLAKNGAGEKGACAGLFVSGKSVERDKDLMTG